LPSVAPVRLFQPAEVEAFLVATGRGQRRHHALTHRLVMTSSGASIASASPHPEAAGDEAEAGDGRLPQDERLACPEISGDHQPRKAESDRRERREPKAGQTVAEQEVEGLCLHP
jgi:hypothetical protein